MATRTITGSITRPDGTPWAGAPVRFILTDDTFTASPAETYPLVAVDAVTDASGDFTVSLVSGLDKNYKVTLPDRSTFEITVAAGSATTLEFLRAATVGTPAALDNVETALLALYGSPPVGRAAVAVQEGDVTVVTEAAIMDFDASDFNITEAPTGEANIALAYGTGAGTPAEGNHNHDLVYAPLSHSHTLADLGLLEIYQASDYTGTSNSAAAQKIFNGSANGAAAVVSGGVYQLQGMIHIHTADTDSAFLNLLFGGTRTINWIRYKVDTQFTTADDTFGAAGTFTVFSTTAGATVLSGANATAKHYNIFIDGMVAITTLGTFIPQYQWSAANQSSPITAQGSWLRLTPVPSNPIGSWS